MNISLHAVLPATSPLVPRVAYRQPTLLAASRSNSSQRSLSTATTQTDDTPAVSMSHRMRQAGHGSNAAFYCAENSSGGVRLKGSTLTADTSDSNPSHMPRLPVASRQMSLPSSTATSCPVSSSLPVFTSTPATTTTGESSLSAVGAQRRGKNGPDGGAAPAMASPESHLTCDLRGTMQPMHARHPLHSPHCADMHATPSAMVAARGAVLPQLARAHRRQTRPQMTPPPPAVATTTRVVASTIVAAAGKSSSDALRLSELDLGDSASLLSLATKGGAASVTTDPFSEAARSSITMRQDSSGLLLPGGTTTTASTAGGTTTTPSIAGAASGRCAHDKMESTTTLMPLRVPFLPFHNQGFSDFGAWLLSPSTRRVSRATSAPLGVTLPRTSSPCLPMSALTANDTLCGKSLPSRMMRFCSHNPLSLSAACSGSSMFVPRPESLVALDGCGSANATPVRGSANAVFADGALVLRSDSTVVPPLAPLAPACSDDDLPAAETLPIGSSREDSNTRVATVREVVDASRVNEGEEHAAPRSAAATGVVPRSPSQKSDTASAIALQLQQRLTTAERADTSPPSTSSSFTNDFVKVRQLARSSQAELWVVRGGPPCADSIGTCPSDMLHFAAPAAVRENGASGGEEFLSSRCRSWMTPTCCLKRFATLRAGRWSRRRRRWRDARTAQLDPQQS